MLAPSSPAFVPRARAAAAVLRHLLVERAAGTGYIGEPVSTASHMVQAARRARALRLDEDVVLACLFHDVGHLVAADDTGGFGVSDHARLGAALLRGLGLAERTCRAVELHADAKRYLVGEDPFYRLTPASAATLESQGGPMASPDDRRAFEGDPAFEDALAVRDCDDTSKAVGLSPAVVDRAFATFLPAVLLSVRDTAATNLRLPSPPPRPRR